jgi:hypothetical protein
VRGVTASLGSDRADCKAITVRWAAQNAQLMTALRGFRPAARGA